VPPKLWYVSAASRCCPSYIGSGDLVPGFVRYKFMFDPSRVRDTMTTQTATDPSGNPITIRTPSGVISALQDFFITFQSSVADVSIGQFKNTVSWEGFASSARLVLPERQFMANLLGGQRDIGLRIDKTFKTFMYSLIRARDVFTNGGAAVEGQGFYGALAYRIGELGSGNWKGVLQPVVRVGYYDPNIAVDLDPTMVAAGNFGGNDERMDFEVGLNYYLRAYELKLQVGFDRQQFDNRDAKAPINELIAAAQVSF